MKRRKFVKAALLTAPLAGALPTLGATAAANAPKMKPEFYELRVYTLADVQQQKRVEEYFQNAAIPALNRLGSKTVGVFTEMEPEDQTKLYALIPYASAEELVTRPTKLAKDAAYQRAGASYLMASATEPAYTRIQSSFFQAFETMPRLELPGKKSRIFELRRYESHSELASRKKIEMFNQAGEIAIFKRVGLKPVFFGEALIGEMRPNLTYLLTFEDMAEHDRNWKTFGSDPEWQRIRSMSDYADAKIVSHITRTFLVPTAFSQV